MTEDFRVHTLCKMAEDYFCRLLRDIFEATAAAVSTWINWPLTICTCQ